MVVILAIAGIIFLLCISGSRQTSHLSTQQHLDARKKFNDAYIETYDDDSNSRVFLKGVRGEEREKLVAELKDVLNLLPYGDRYASAINAKTDLSNQFYRDILCAKRGKLIRRTYPWSAPTTKVHPGTYRGGVPCDEKSFTFEEARLDWIVTELNRHGLTTPLYARSNQGSETRTVDWKGRPHYSGKFFVPYKERPLDKSCDLVWNYEGKPPIYPG